jgi:hypothetical protein
MKLQMKLQQPFPFNTTNAEGTHTSIGKDYFSLSAQNLINNDCTISTGRTYILILNNPNDGIQTLYVRLANAFYLGERMHIILEDLMSKRRISIVHNTNSHSNESTWMLVDWEYFQKRVEDAVVKSYCGCD